MTRRRGSRIAVPVSGRAAGASVHPHPAAAALPVDLVGFCLGDPFGPHSWSGSNRGIFTALRDALRLVQAFDVEVRGPLRYWAALREYSPNRMVWKHNFLKSPYQFALRSRTAGRLLGRLPRRPDAVLQIGAMFDATAADPALPRYCYLDSNCALSERGGSQSFSHYARADYKRRSFERERSIYRNSAGLFVFSDFVRDSLVRDFGVAPAKIHTVYAGVNMSVPHVPSGPAEEPVVLFIGRDFERKGGPLLLEAFAQVRARISGARLIIAGASPQVAAPGVEVAGFIDKASPAGEAKLASLYRQAAVFTMPSHFEPFGIVYAEAMHFGLPCVGVRHCAMPEIITQDVTGLLVPPRDARSLADALIRLLTDRDAARRMGRAGHEKARREFRWESVARRMAAVIGQERARRWAGN